MPSPVRVVRALTMLLAAGCLTTPVQNAQTLGKGNTQVGIEPGLLTGEIGGNGALSLPALPTGNVSMRHGLADDLDLGVRIGTSLYDLHLKYMFTNPDSGGPIVSIVPSTTLFATRDMAYAQVKMPLLLGFGTDKQLVLGPYVDNRFAFGEALRGRQTATYNLLTIGTSVGYSIKVNETLRIMPDFGAGFPISKSTGGGEINLDTELIDSPSVTFTLGFLVGESN